MIKQMSNGEIISVK